MDEEPDKAFELYEIGRLHMEAGRLAEAVAAFTESARMMPHYKTFERLGESLMRLGDPAAAVMPLAAATALNRGVRAASLLAESLLLGGWANDAEMMSRVALDRDPNNRKALQVLHDARAKLEQRRGTDALEQHWGKESREQPEVE